MYNGALFGKLLLIDAGSTHSTVTVAAKSVLPNSGGGFAKTTCIVTQFGTLSTFAVAKL